MFVLPVIAFSLFCFLYLGKKRNVIEAVIVSWLFITLCTWIITEFFSLFSLINTISTVVSWLVICIVLAVWGIRTRLFHQAADHIIKEYKSGKYKRDANFICVVAFCLFICILSVLRSQDQVDNLYHRLTKIMHWIQNGNIGYFATCRPEEILYPQLVEYMHMQIYLLRGSDRIITLVQAGAYLISACCVYGISRKLGVSRKFAWLSVWIYLLIPMVIIETLTTQTDVAAGAYLLCFVYFLPDYIQADQLGMDRNGALSAVCLAASAMFGYLAKPTVCFAMIVFFLWMCIVRLIKRDRFTVLMQYTVIGLAIALILFLPSYIRKYQYRHAPSTVASGSETGTDTSGSESDTDTSDSEAGTDTSGTTVEVEANIAESVTDGIMDPRVFLAVAIRNIAANSTSRCFPRINDLIVRVVDKCDRVLHYEDDENFQVMVTLGLGETSEPSPVIMYFCLAAWICVITRMSKVNKMQLMYFICATLALIVQSGLMDYTHFRQRYLIGAMAVLCPAFAVTLDQIKIGVNYKVQIATAMIVISAFGTVNMLTYEIPYVIFGLQGGKLHGYFMSNSENELYYGLMLDYINENDYRTVGMDWRIPYEYVLWQGIDNLERMEHVNIPVLWGTSAKLEDHEFIPDCIVITETKAYIAEGDLMSCHGQTYRCGWRADNEKGENYAVMVRQ